MSDLSKDIKSRITKLEKRLVELDTERINLMSELDAARKRLTNKQTIVSHPPTFPLPRSTMIHLLIPRSFSSASYFEAERMYTHGDGKTRRLGSLAISLPAGTNGSMDCVASAE